MAVNSYLQFVLYLKLSQYKMSNWSFPITDLRFSMVFILFSIFKNDYRFHIRKLSSNFTYVFHFSRFRDLHYTLLVTGSNLRLTF